MPKLAQIGGALAVAATSIVLLQCAGSTVDEDLSTERDLHGAGFVTSSRCVQCHDEHGTSWARTYHRTMTQEASAESVLGPFDGTSVDYLGWRATMVQESGEFIMNVLGPEGQRERYVVDRTVGSHRYQQYLARAGDSWFRLPWAFHVEENRWFHMNGAFLTPDPQTPVASDDDHERHVVRWNDNCVFCHNVGPNPGLSSEGFATEVAELGVACEACHGPGEEHASVNGSPLRRYTLHAGERADPTIVNPARLDPERAADVCGRCHGQRITSDVGPFLRDGDPFVPGDDLARYSEPLWSDTTLNGSLVFEPRFWRDGTPRLTAYEYQGFIQSRCRGQFTCTTCHGMHEGDPAGQLRPPAEPPHDLNAPIRPSSLSDSPCVTCHETEEDHAGAGHAEVQCVDCHMPRIVYGVLDIHRSHRIEIPMPTVQWRSARPDACSLCHLGEPPAFFEAVAQVHAPNGVTQMDGPNGDRNGDGNGDGPSDSVSLGLRWLLSGDPIERAVAADAYGTSPVVSSAQADQALCTVLIHETYPAVRRLAWRALRRRHQELRAEEFDPMASRDERTNQVALVDPCEHQLDALLVERLQSPAAPTNIEIGE